MVKIRGFEAVSYTSPKLPTRADDRSAGYDFYLNETVVLEAGEQKTVWTDVKAYMLPNEVLNVYPRSSIGVRYGVVLANTVGVIDSSYYNNSHNEGNIGLVLKNTGTKTVWLSEGTRVAQGVFMPYLVADIDTTFGTVRNGGFGSSGH